MFYPGSEACGNMKRHDTLNFVFSWMQAHKAELFCLEAFTFSPENQAHNQTTDLFHSGSLAAGFCCVEQTAVDSTEMGKRKLARGKADPLVSVILPFRNSCRCGTS